MINWLTADVEVGFNGCWKLLWEFTKCCENVLHLSVWVYTSRLLTDPNGGIMVLDFFRTEVNLYNELLWIFKDSSLLSQFLFDNF